VTQRELVTVGWAYGPAEAALVTALLLASGITVFPHSWYLATIRWDWTHALGGIELKVPAGQADDARALLAQNPVARRPRHWLWHILVAVVAVAVLYFVNIPPPASGFFFAGRPAYARQQEPLQP